MQKQQFVIKGLFFGLFGIIAFSSSVFAEDVSGVWIQNNTPLTTKTVGVTVTSPSPTIPQSITLPEGDACTKKANQDLTNATIWWDTCKKTNTATACNKQYEEQKKIIANTLTACQEGGTSDSVETTGSTRGITINPKCLKNGQCGFNIYEFLGFEGKSNDPTVFVQDILLSASFFIGTVITIALIYSGFLFVTAGISWNSKNADSAKNWIKYSIIGLLIVICSYSLIRLVQYIAKGL